MEIVASQIREVYRELQDYHNWRLPTVLVKDGLIAGKNSLHGISDGGDGQIFLAGEPDPDRWQWSSIFTLLPIIAQLDQRRITKDCIVYADASKDSKQIIDLDKTIEAKNKLLLANPDALSQKHSYSHIDYFKELSHVLGQRMTKADWYYEYSDDHRVWEKGNEEIKGIINDLEKLAKTEQGFEISKSLWEKHVPEYSVHKPDFLNDDIFYKQSVNVVNPKDEKVEKTEYTFGLDAEGNIISKSRGELFKNLDERMKRADWDYPYSDDYIVRRRGEEEVNAIKRDLEILSFSKGGAVIANALWDEHTIRSAIWKPDFLHTAMELQRGELKREDIGLTGHLNQKIMETNSSRETNNNPLAISEKEINHLKNQFKHIGAEKAFTPGLVEQLKAGIPEKSHSYTFDNKGDNAEAVFHLKKGKDSNLYFLNKYDMTVNFPNTNKTVSETFYITGQDNVQLKEGEEKLHNVNRLTIKKAANYLAGRPVYNAFSDKDGNQFEAWAKRKFNVEKGKFEMVKYRKEYPFSLDDATKNYSIKELATPQFRDRLMESYKRGNLQKVTFVGHGGREEKLYTSLQIGLVAGGSLNVYDLNKDRVSTEQLVEKGFVGQNFAQQINDRLAQKQEKQSIRQDSGTSHKNEHEQPVNKLKIT